MAEAAGFQRARPLPATLSSPSWEEWKRTGRAAWDAVVETPARLRRAFTFSTPAPGVDAMGAIQGTMVEGAKGFKNVKKQLQEAAK